MAIVDKIKYTKEKVILFSNKESFTSSHFFHGPIKVFNGINGTGGNKSLLSRLHVVFNKYK
jgi:hypothetical protein